MRQEQATIYIAIDGKEFINEADCLAYEKLLSTTHYFLAESKTFRKNQRNPTLLIVTECSSLYDAQLVAEYYLQISLGNRIALNEDGDLVPIWSFNYVPIPDKQHLIEEARKSEEFSEIELKPYKRSK